MRRKALALALTAAVLVPATSLPAEAHHRPGPCAIHWWKAWHEWGATDPIRRLIRCAVARWPVPGGAPKALSVAACESGFRPDASGYGNGGVFQHRYPYWDGRYRYFTERWWRLWPNIYNGRTNVIVSIRMAHVGGWGPWSCA